MKFIGQERVTDRFLSYRSWIHLLAWIWLLFCTVYIAGCNNQTGENPHEESSRIVNTDTLAIETQSNPISLTDLFTYHKQFKVNDTLTFDVLSWGSDSKGNYLILKSDKLSNRYFSISGQREGKIINSFITDMDVDMQAEIIIVTQSQPDSRGSLYAHEIDSLNEKTDIILPELAPDLKKGYTGKDTFFITQDKLIREFPITRQAGKQGNKRIIEYTFRNNTFILSGNKE